ncbi:MFS transporter [Kitasatospora sp. NBC_00458]|uniref:MFS transporter n=1 Tax=Kitasatospora sp. NBC_00458 TaxID=2903568 RepID=UPI003FA606F3
MALGSVAFAFSPSWPLALLGALVTGFGFGGIDYGLNQLFATGFGQRGPAMLNILNAHFGIGAIAGPALIGLLGADRYPAVFTAFAVMAALLLIPLGGVRGRTSGGRPAGAAGHPANLPARRTAALLTAFVVLYVLHVGVEAGVGGWEPTHLAAVGHSTTLAASATSVYWLMLTLGRFLVAPLTLRWSEPAIIAASCTGMALCLLAAVLPGLAPYAYAGVGLFIAPIFPTGLPWLRRTVPAAQRAGALVIAASMVGGVAAGPALGKIIELSEVRMVPAVLFILAVVCLAATWWLTRATRPPSAASGDPGSPLD